MIAIALIAAIVAAIAAGHEFSKGSSSAGYWAVTACLWAVIGVLNNA